MQIADDGRIHHSFLYTNVIFGLWRPGSAWLHFNIHWVYDIRLAFVNTFRSLRSCCKRQQLRRVAGWRL